MKRNSLEEQKELEEAKATFTPEQLKQHTMLEISEIVLQQFIENIMLNIEITPIDEKQNVAISLQASEFIEENTLLKDSYNLLNELQHVAAINDITLKWFMPVRNKNTEVLTLTVDEKSLLSISDISYKVIPQVAIQYNKHETID